MHHIWRVTLVASLLALVVLSTGCRPQTNPLQSFTHADGHAAIDLAFGPLGTTIVECAHGVAHEESNHWPYSGWGRKYKGMLQTHDGFAGSLQRAVAELEALGRPGHWPSPFDPYSQSFAARYAFEAAGGSFRANWPGTTPAGCP